MGRAFVASLLTALFFATGGTAAEPGVQCLQAVLNAAGYDAGPVDGKIGPRTRNALAAFRQDTPLDTSKPLNSKTALVFCRLAGDAREELKDAWPSRRLPYRVIYSEAVVERARRDLGTGLDRVPQVFATALPFELPLTAVIHVVANTTEFEQALRDEFGYSKSRARARAEGQCATRGTLSGLASFQGIIVCLNRGPKGSRPALMRSDVWGNIAHELWHDAQYQLAGDDDFTRDSRGQFSSHGPVWLTEGSAEFVEASMLVGPDLTERRMFKALWAVRSWTTQEWADLKPLSPYPYEGRLPNLAYLSGHVAVLWLVERNGPDSLARYYDAIGRGLEWPVAFERTFGLTIYEFYRDFLAWSKEAVKIDPRLSPQ